MDIQTLLYNLREEVTCPVCSDVFTEPKHLSCLHSFCLKCLKHWHATCGGGNVVKCPKCQTQCRVPASGDLTDLPTSFYLNGFIDVLAIKECNKTQVTCGNCDKKSSEASYCFHCCIFYCEKCLIGHNSMRGNKTHRILAVKDFQDMDYEGVLKRPVFCPRQGHQNEELKYFCQECETAVCQTCVTVDHEGHRKKIIEEEAQIQKLEVKTMIQTQKRNLQSKIDIVTQLDENCAKLIQQSENVKRDVENFADGLIKTIEAKKQNMIASVERQTKESLEKLTTTKTEIQRKIDVFKMSLEEAEKQLTRSTNAEIVQLKNSLKTIFERVDQTEPIAHDTLVFVENQKMHGIVNGEKIGSLEGLYQTKTIQSLAEGEGLKEGTVGRKAQFSLITRNAERRQGYDKRDRVTVEIRDEQGRECVTQVQIDDNKNGVYNISYSPRVQGRCKIFINVNGEHVGGSPFTLLVKPAFHVKPILSFGKRGSRDGMFQLSCGVAVNDRDKIVVADFCNHRVQIWNSNGNFLRSFGHFGQNQGQFNRPAGIAVNKDRNMFIVDNSNHRVQIFIWEGRHLGSFGGKGSLDSQLTNPCGLSLNTNGNVIVADSGNKLIKIFSTDGRFLMKIGGQGSFSYPIHCVQCGEYLIVSDHLEHCIKVYNREGQFQYKFGKQGGGDGEFNYPCCLSVTKSQHLLVCDYDNNRIQVFELNGTFVAKFGTKGNKLGEFSGPWAVAILSNDKIVVSDQNNDRIQIFQ